MMQVDKICWLNETPVSTLFNDVYFNTEQPLSEAEYVFLEGNKLIERFETHTKESFVIAETGFGTGLNFILTWILFEKFKLKSPHSPLKNLHFISVEKFPLSIDDIKIIYKKSYFNILPTEKIQFLLDNWLKPSLLTDGNISLLVLNEDVSQLAYYLETNAILIDAWFFDGFCPSKNPEMWSASLFSDLYSCTEITGTFSSFTASGSVRRNLQEAGFFVQKKCGYGKKREMLVGYK